MSIIKIDASMSQSNKDRDRVKASRHALRDLFLNRIAGIAFFTEDAALKEECKAIRTAILNITEDEKFLQATTYDEMEDALIIAYRGIASKVSPSIRNVFKELEVIDGNIYETQL